MNWRASFGLEPDIVKDSMLSGELVSTTGQAVCEAGQQGCSFVVLSKPDEVHLLLV